MIKMKLKEDELNCFPRLASLAKNVLFTISFYHALSSSVACKRLTLQFAL